MRAALTDLYGVDKPLPEQYVNFCAASSKATSGRRCSPFRRRR